LKKGGEIENGGWWKGDSEKTRGGLFFSEVYLG